MGRIRTIKPEFFTSRSLARVSRDARLTFAGLWTQADDYGRGIADERLLKGAIWPLDDEITPEVIHNHLGELEREHIRIYQVAGDQYYEVQNWNKHLAAAYRRGDARYPAPPEMQTPTPPHDSARPEMQDRAVREGNREGNEDDNTHTMQVQTPPPDTEQSSSSFTSIQELAHELAGRLADKRTDVKRRKPWVDATARNLIDEREPELLRILANGHTLDAAIAIIDTDSEQTVPKKPQPQPDPDCDDCGGTGVALVDETERRYGPCPCRRPEPHTATIHPIRPPETA